MKPLRAGEAGRSPPPGEGAHRPVCPRCTRPEVVCVCSLIPSLDPRTRVLFLQHPRERRMPIGTARLAHLALAGSALRVGVDFSGDRVVAAALAERPLPHVLFPGPGALPLAALRPVEGAPAPTIIVLDGTWSEAKKLLTRNPALAALPRVAFAPTQKSAYQIRRQPADHCVSTIEALAHVLAALEPAGFPADRLLAPFLAMVERQRRYATEIHAARHRRLGPRVVRVPAGLSALAAARPRLVAIHAEANAWPLRHPAWRPAELLHFTAHRLATGATLDLLVRPRGPLAPATLRHLELDESALAAAPPIESVRPTIAAFLRPDDLLVHWGPFVRDLTARDALLPAATFDLRPAHAQWHHRRATSLDTLAPATLPPLRPGRAPRRLHTLTTLLTQADEITWKNNFQG